MVIFEITRNAQIWPRTQYAVINGTADGIYLMVSDIVNGSKSHRDGGSGQDYLLGTHFLERFYSVYDTAHSRVGLAKTRYTH
jgi:cathepsin E